MGAAGGLQGGRCVSRRRAGKNLAFLFKPFDLGSTIPANRVLMGAGLEEALVYPPHKLFPLGR